MKSRREKLNLALEQTEPAQPYDGEIQPLMSPYEAPADSVFHPDNIQPVTLIQITRLLDVGMALLAVVDPDKALALAEAHARGETFSPAPAFMEDEE